ncbi:MAG: hypothetical protein LBU65_03310 [Planctomycetaceae bacterium]|nr:hypothetical protein [Planctomycetaceae bacterium]
MRLPISKWIPEWLLVIIITVLGVIQGGLVYYVFSISMGSPCIQVDKTEVDFGVIPPN